MLIVALAAAALLGGCHRQGIAPQPGSPTLRVYCGAGIRDALESLASEFQASSDVRIEPDFAGSNILLSRLKLTGEGDLFMPGDQSYVDSARSEGLVAEERIVCYLVPTILVPRGNPARIRGLGDLARPGVALGLGDAEACAIGRISQEVLERSEAPSAAIAANTVFSALTVDELAVQVVAGKLDATIVWDVVARRHPDQAEALPIPIENNVVSVVSIATLTCSTHPEAADSFAAFATSDRAKVILEWLGYATEPPR